MSRRSRWIALACAIFMAGGGAAIAFLLAGGPWAGVGAVIGAITGAFAPSFYDGLHRWGATGERWKAIIAKKPPQSMGRLLDARLELVNFVGREDELTALMVWCGDHDTVRLRLMTGPGGVGKTRLAIELSERMKRRGWISETIAAGSEAEAIPALRAASPRPALLIVDYAETRVGLNKMLVELTSKMSTGIRLLMLARSAGDWWDQLGVNDPLVWDTVQAAKSAQISLSSAVADVPDGEIVAQAVESFAHNLGLPVRDVRISGGEGPGQRRVLDLHAAALVAVLRAAGTREVPINIEEVLDELLRHEQHFWYETAHASGLTDGPEGMTSAALRQIVAAGCLLGATSETEARALIGRVPGLSPSSKAADWLRSLYPPFASESEWLGSLQPDRLAELHVLRELTASFEFAQSCLTDLDARQALRVVALLARASADYPQAEDLLRKTLPDMVDLVANVHAPLEMLISIFKAIPYPTIILASSAVTLGQRILRLLPTDTPPAIQANWLHDLGIRLSECGRSAESLKAAQEALTIRRKLAATWPNQYGIDLAKSLNNVGIYLRELGRYAEALTITEEAVAMYRALAAADPDSFRPDLALSLHNLGVRLSTLGRLPEALEIEQEAVAIRRELALAKPDQYLRSLADSLDNISVTLADLERPIDSLRACEEAVDIYRGLAAESPDRHLPSLAESLNNFGATLSSLGRSADALAAEEEAVAIRRELAAATPERYRPDLAQSLANIGVTYAELGRPKEGRHFTEEGTAMYRSLAAAQPERYLPDLAECLSMIAEIYIQTGEPAEALTLLEESVRIRRELTTSAPKQYQPELIASLTKLSDVLRTLGRNLDSDTARAEAAQLNVIPGG